MTTKSGFLAALVMGLFKILKMTSQPRVKSVLEAPYSLVFELESSKTLVSYMRETRIVKRIRLIGPRAKRSNEKTDNYNFEV